MNQDNFNINRLFNFIQRQVSLNLPPMLIAAGGIFGLLLVVSLFVAYFDPRDIREINSFYLTVFFIGGFIFTSRIFSELNSPQKSYFYLTLPVSTLEKVIGSWVLSSPVYVVVFSVGIFIIYLITGLVAGGNHASIPDMFDKHYFQSMGVYMVTQTVFFLGAAYFRNYNFLKTLLALFVLQVIIGSYSGLLGWMLFGSKLQSEDFSGGFQYFVEYTIPQIAHVLFWYLLAPFLLVVSYFSLKERQV
ncbi:hypothetical protein GXP67_19890 [Rhodocytophaga rosea]|uniref:ABC transporter permease n=1 Tax=Rhodocytophaga rosea TaxID=2704465 RepID=A0A6C0GL55_9BACT|nr:hypothetical protein [Rhodocytophaga rosea]QHT68745.1 hypothetical protein GXP67_19890 [Rhodocytophaga rosea]